MTLPCILIVEDEPSIVALLTAVLRDRGYRVLSAGSATEAWSMGRLHQGEIALLLCDVVLSDRAGPEVALRIKELCPHVRTLFFSGYPLETLAERGLLTPDILRTENALYIQKPFRLEELLNLVEFVFSSQMKVTSSALEQTGFLRVNAAH